MRIIIFCLIFRNNFQVILGAGPVGCQSELVTNRLHLEVPVNWEHAAKVERLRPDLGLNGFPGLEMNTCRSSASHIMARMRL